MPSYVDYRDNIERARTLLVEGIQTLADEQFKQDHDGTTVRQVLPGDNEEYQFSFQQFSGYIRTKTRTYHNLIFDGTSLTVNHLAANPAQLDSICDALYEAWDTIFGLPAAKQSRGGPGEPPIERDNFQVLADELIKQYELLCADPRVADFVRAIQDQNHRLAIQFLGETDAESVIDPTAGHELYNLFMNRDIHVIYEDESLALVKPEYRTDAADVILNEQWDGHLKNADVTVFTPPSRRRTAVNMVPVSDENLRVITDDSLNWPQVVSGGENPQEAFVVGKDDTPTGLFIHSVDGTRLDPTQTVTKTQIQDIMGFDWFYGTTQPDTLHPTPGERIRLQGDLVVEYLSQDGVTDAGNCPIPIDNHYIALDSATLASNETKDQEPITVRTTDKTHLNVAHDEHANVAVQLTEGTYQFSLLTRGLRRSENRPDWEESADTA